MAAKIVLVVFAVLILLLVIRRSHKIYYKSRYVFLSSLQ